MEEHEILFAAKFYLDNKRAIHTRHPYNILMLMSEFGGFFRSIFDSLNVLGYFFNQRMFIGKVLWEEYFIKNYHRNKKSKHKKDAKSAHGCITVTDFTYSDKFSHIKLYFCKAFCCKFNQEPKKFLKKSEFLYQKGYEMVEDHINIFRFINSVRKMEAGLSAVIEGDPKLI